MNRSLCSFAIVLGGCAGSSAQPYPALSGIVETYFASNVAHAGFAQQISWAEFYWRLSPKLRGVGSYMVYPGGGNWDELYGQYDEQHWSVRAGRIRTAFGFNNWSEIFYNGFNQVPLVRATTLTGSLGLSRQDSGVELTGWNGPIQLQAAVVDVELGDQQIRPRNLNYNSLRAQCTSSGAIVGLDYLRAANGLQSIYGFDVRYTFASVVLRAEAFKGDGPEPEKGYYIDASYRIRPLIRTEIVFRNEAVDPGEGLPLGRLDTAGLREIISKNLTVNLNYSWGSHVDYSQYASAPGFTGWSARAMFQVQF